MRVLVIGALLLTAGCQTARPDDPATRGKTIFDGYCAACHGAGGRGDGPLAADLPVTPADLAMLSAGNGGVFPTEPVMAQIYGYPGRFHRGLMPEFGPLLDGPKVDWTAASGEVIETPQALLDLVAYLETIQN